jgi:hypothetical protein
MAVRTFSMSAGLDTSTVTPGRTAPEASLTTPAIPLVCAAAIAGAATQDSARKIRNNNLRITPAPLPDAERRDRPDPSLGVDRVASAR